MRITQNMISNIFVRNIQKQTEAMLQRQEQIVTQKRINRPSDDPAGMARVLDGRSTVAAIDQYVENIKQGKTRLEITETTLEQVDELVQQAWKLAQANSGDEITDEQRALAAEKVKGIYDHVMQLANSRFGGRYMFAGYQTDTAPFTRNADPNDPADDYTAVYHGDDGSFQIPIADNVKVSVDADGENYFQDAANGGVNIFDQLQDLINGLENARARRTSGRPSTRLRTRMSRSWTNAPRERPSSTGSRPVNSTGLILKQRSRRPWGATKTPT